MINKNNIQAPRKTSRRLAFTLAETLITLTIIGVVAAMTIPTLMTKYQKHTYVVGLKKAYSVLSNAVAMIPISEGCPAGDLECAGFIDTFEFEGSFVKHISEESLKKLAKQLKTIKECPAGGSGCGPDFVHQVLYQSSKDYGTFLDYASFLSADGMAWSTSQGNVIYVDINGNKEPNRYGRDVFTFYIALNEQNGVKQGTVMPDGSEIYCKYNAVEDCVNTCGDGPYGSHDGCTGKVLQEDAMNY